MNAPGAGDTQRPAISSRRLHQQRRPVGSWPGSDAQPANGADYSWVDGFDWAPQSPSYQWRFDQGQKAVEAQQSRRRRLLLRRHSDGAAKLRAERSEPRVRKRTGADGELAGTARRDRHHGQRCGPVRSERSRQHDPRRQRTRHWLSASRKRLGQFLAGAAGIPMYAYRPRLVGGKG